MRAALEMPEGRGYVKRRMTNVVRVLRAALYDLYDQKPVNQLGVTEVEIHNYLNAETGTFVPIEFEDAIMHLVHVGDVAIDDTTSDQRYRLTPAGHFAEEDARLKIWQRWWRDVKREFGTRLFWLLIGAGLVIVQRLIWP